MALVKDLQSLQVCVVSHILMLWMSMLPSPMVPNMYAPLMISAPLSTTLVLSMTPTPQHEILSLNYLLMFYKNIFVPLLRIGMTYSLFLVVLLSFQKQKSTSGIGNSIPKDMQSRTVMTHALSAFKGHLVTPCQFQSPPYLNHSKRLAIISP